MRTLRIPALSKAAKAKVVAAACLSTLLLAACGAGGAAGTDGVTCDEYSRKEYAPAGLGAEAQTSDLLDLLKENGRPWSVPLLNEVQDQVNEFCGRPSPDGGKPAKRNNSRPISEGVDWSMVG